MLLDRLAETSEAVAATRSRSAKAELIARALGELAPEEAELGVAYLSGELPGARVGVGYASAFGSTAPPAAAASLDLSEVARRLQEIAGLSGAGSAARRKSLLLALFALATEREQRFLRALLVGELRQGALGAVMEEAVARAFRVPAPRVRRAVFKGMTDAMLTFQTDALQKLEIGREGHVVHVRPELVVEVAFDGVQTSREYPGGVALRFARVRRYRSDKTALDADGIARVRALAGLGV